MFKPLLRTIPTLSGNISLSCNINEYTQSKADTDTFETYIRTASLIPLQNTLYDKIINVNLLDGRWEYDIKKFYKYYSNYFYKTNFTYDEIDYKLLEREPAYPQEQRNRDYEFGCKRFPNSQGGYQFNFYAPIYIDNVNSIPDYFQIDIYFSNNVEKHIKIHLADNKRNLKNYLYNYIKRFVEQIDDNVVYCLHESNQGTYFGIDAKRGGLVQIKDNVLGVIYNRQYSINNFDWAITQGFVRNELMMRQVIPLSFSFNINDILTRREKKYLLNNVAKIKGKYYTNNIAEEFYDFSCDYTDYTIPLRKYIGYNKQETVYSSNVMDCNYPGLHEARATNFKYSNKLTPQYTRWKLKYSSDEDPYITNMSWSFSYMYKTNKYQYGNYPVLFNNNKPNAIIDETNNKNLILPTNIHNENEIDDGSRYDEDVKYINALNSHASDWFEITDDISSALQNTSLWSEVKDNQVYYNGILYNLNPYLDSIQHKISIDKFGVFVNADYTNTDDEDAKKMTKSKFVVSYYATNPDLSFNCNINRDLSNTYCPLFTWDEKGIDACLENSCIMKEDNDYTYTEINGTTYYTYSGRYVKLEDYNKYNKYYNVTQLSNLAKTYNDTTICDAISYFLSYDVTFTYSFEKLPIAHNRNLCWAKNSDITQAYTLFKDDPKFYDDDSVNSAGSHRWPANTYLHYLTYYPLVDEEEALIKRPQGCNSTYTSYLLYVSPKYNSTYFPINKDGNFGVLKQDIATERYTFLLKKQFIAAYYIDSYSYTDNSSITEQCPSYYSTLSEYNYIPLWQDDDLILNSCFEKSTANKTNLEVSNIEQSDHYGDFIYIDEYNLYNFIDSYSNAENNYLTDKNFTKSIENIGSFIDSYNALNTNNTISYKDIINEEILQEYCGAYSFVEYWNDIVVRNVEEPTSYEYTFSEMCETDTKLMNFISHYQSEVSLYNNSYDKATTSGKIRKEYDSYSFIDGAALIDNSKLSSYIKQYIPQYNTYIKNSFIDEDAYCFAYAKFISKEHIVKYHRYLNRDTNYTLLNSYIIENPLSYIYYRNDYLVRNAYDNELKIMSKYNSIYDMLNETGAIGYLSNTTGVDKLNKVVSLINGSNVNTDTDLNMFRYTDSYSTTFLDLYFHKKFYRLTENLYNLMMYGESEIEPLFLYTLNNDCEDNYLTFTVANYDEIDNSYIDYNACLKPLVSNIYKSDSVKSEITNMVQANNVVPVKVNGKTYYRNSNYEVDCFIELPNYAIQNIPEDKLQYYANLTRYDKQYSVAISSISYEGSITDNEYNLNVVYNENTNSYYGFYYINVDYTPTKFSFNINNDETLTFNMINGKNYTPNKFKYVVPFLTSSLFNEYSTIAKLMVVPQTFELSIKYVAAESDNGNTPDTYKYRMYNLDDQYANGGKTYNIMFVNNSGATMKLNRYLNRITPLITKKTNIDNMYQLRFKNINKTIDENNLYRSNVKIYKYTPLKYITEYNSTSHEISESIFDTFVEHEYKHFNDNLLYNLVENIEIKIDKLLSYNELLTYETEDVTFKYFADYINKTRITEYDNNIMLFLYKKYNVSYVSDVRYLDALKTKKLYNLTYKFTLI